MTEAVGSKHHERNFDRRLWNRFFRIARPYWFGEERWRARALLLGLILLLAVKTQVTVLFNDQSGEFTSALAAKDPDRFWQSIRFFGLVLIGAVPTYAFYYYVRDLLGISWRRWTTARFVENYLTGRAYYRLGWDTSIDNPDQRIAADVATFTQKSLLFLLDIAGAILQLIAFSGILWSISHTLVLFLVVYAAVGTWITFGIFGRPMIGLNFQQLRREADLRFSLIRIREHAEAIAFYRGEQQEQDQVTQRFDALHTNYTTLLRRTLNLNLFQYAYAFVTLVAPSIIVAPRIISGELEVGRAVQASGAFAAMLGALTVFVENFETLSAFAAGIERLHSFSRAIDPKLQAIHHSARASIKWEEADQLRLENVTVLTPNRQRTLLRGVSLELNAGDGLLILGASGGGKSSLLRAIAGLWDAGSGTIGHPKLEDSLFLPQRPYMVSGTLRQQLQYPRSNPENADTELLQVLELVNLKGIVERCGGFDTELDFGKMLSVGEQQRLAVARVLLIRPKFVVLDEATSALDSQNEAQLYSQIQSLGVTLVSVAHRNTLVKYHSKVLELQGDGSFVLLAAKDYRES